MHKNKEEYKKEINSIDDIKCIIKGLCKDIDNVDKVYSSLSSFSFIIDDMIERPHVFLNSLFSESKPLMKISSKSNLFSKIGIFNHISLSINNLFSLFLSKLISLLKKELISLYAFILIRIKIIN